MEPGNGADGDSPANPDGDSGGGLSDDPFVEMKVIRVHGIVPLRVPAIWPFEWDEKAGMWCCCEDREDPAEDTGTLWIDVDVVELDGPIRGAEARAAVLDKIAARICRDKAGAHTPVEVSDIEFGKLVKYRREFERDKHAFTEHRWHSLSLVTDLIGVLHYSLILTAETRDRPAWRRLVETMDREIRAATFGSAGALPDGG